jgi:hypothetical protein
MKSRLNQVLQFTPVAFAGLLSNFDPDWIRLALALAHCGEAQTRRRKLPVDVALWIVIGIALFRDRSIHEVVMHLELVLKDANGNRVVSAGAIPECRRRLGSEPVELLFRLTADSWSTPTDEERWNGLSVWAIDGTCLSVPNTESNAAKFARPRNGKGASAFPQVRAVMLMNASTHVMKDFHFGSYSEGEITLLRQMWEKLPDRSLVLLDRGLQSWWAYWSLTQIGTERHVATRAKSSLHYRLVKKLGRGDELIEVDLAKRSPDRVEGADVRTLQLRRITVRRKGYKTQYVLTSMLDPDKYPAAELGELYARRWEIENAYDEVKTELLDGEDVLRSTTPEGIRQELFGIATAYNLVRREMARVAQEMGIPPLRLSFRHSVMLIRNFLVAAPEMAPGAIPRRLASLERDLALLLLPPRRARRCPREVLRRRRQYEIKHRPFNAKRSAN